MLPSPYRHAVVLASITLALSACAPQGPDLSVALDALVMSPDEKHAEASATIAVTEMLNLQLPVDRGTGYGWALVHPLGKDSPVGFAQSMDAPAGDPETTVIGGRSWYLVTLVGNKPGTEVVDLAYQRPWETGVAPAKTYRVRVTVTKSNSN